MEERTSIYTGKKEKVDKSSVRFATILVFLYCAGLFLSKITSSGSFSCCGVELWRSDKVHKIDQESEMIEREAALRKRREERMEKIRQSSKQEQKPKQTHWLNQYRKY